MIVFLIALLFLFVTPVYANVSANISIAAEGAPKFYFSPMNSWTSCSSLISYWTLDNTDLNARTVKNGSYVNDCALLTVTGDASATKVSQEPSFVCRSVKGSSPSNYLNCNDATTCDELNFSNQSGTDKDFTITGWSKAPVASGATDNFGDVQHLLVFGALKTGWSVRSYASSETTGATNDSEFMLGTGTASSFPSPTTLTLANSASHKEFTFFGASYNASTNKAFFVKGGPSSIADRSTSWWVDTDATLSGNLTTWPIGFQVARTTNTTAVEVDELQAWNVVLDEAEKCFLCSCLVTGRLCSISKAGNGSYANKGLNHSHCGSCTLPSLTNYEVACPS